MIPFARFGWLLMMMHIVIASAVLSDPATGPLRVCKENSRYFCDASGKAVYLTGSHVWYNLVDMGKTDPPPAFDFGKYLDWLQTQNHNFIRLWTWEHTTWDTARNNPREQNESTMHFSSPQPWPRTGPGNALDGKPKFDLSRFNPDYFNRLRERVRLAGERGIYVSIMLFEGWAMQFAPKAWENHPFHKENNINGIDGDMNGDGNGLEIHELALESITRLQEEYVKQVIDTVNNFDHVLYEISNENHPPSTEWQYHMINYIHRYEQTKDKQHPVGMTFQYKGGSNRTLFESPADWISPNDEGGYRDNPPGSDGAKVVISDTDHLWGIGGNQAWVWKSFCRGLYPIFMDPYDGLVLGKPFDPQWDPIRKSMGMTRQLANRLDITTMTPQNDVASTGYCLAEAGTKYVMYLPRGNEVTVDLENVSGSFSVRWLDPSTMTRERGGRVDGGAKHTLKSPFGEKDAVLILRRREAAGR